jgi:hypothetical protein
LEVVPFWCTISANSHTDVGSTSADPFLLHCFCEQLYWCWKHFRRPLFAALFLRTTIPMLEALTHTLSLVPVLWWVWLTVWGGQSQWPCGLRHRSWWLGCWDCGFESRLKHGCLSCIHHHSLINLSSTLRKHLKINY